MTPVSKVLELFGSDQVAPGVGRDLFVGGGGYPEQLADAAERTVYYPGGSSTLGELNQTRQAGGPGQVGGSRKRRARSKRKTRRMRNRRRRATR